jgi:hypothetical protein
MDPIFIFASNHPVIAIAITATFLVVLLYFIKKHIWRIVLIGILTFTGYYLYSNGYLTRDKIRSATDIDINDVEKGAQSVLDKGVQGVKSFSEEQAEKEADKMRDDVKKDMMNELKSAPAAGAGKANAAAAKAAKKKSPPAGDK